MADAAAPFRPWQTVHVRFRELARRFLFQTIHNIELMLDRARPEREQLSSVEVIDGQAVSALHPETTRSLTESLEAVNVGRELALLRHKGDGNLQCWSCCAANRQSGGGIPARRWSRLAD